MTATILPVADKPDPRAEWPGRQLDPGMSVAEHWGEAMGSSLHIIATGDQEKARRALAHAIRRVIELEQRWSRFIASSEVSALNAQPGRPIEVSADTITLVARSIEARQLSEGRFDPTLLSALKANGYDRTFVSIKMPTGLAATSPHGIGLGGASIDHHAQTVTLDSATGFDPGGIGKGLAADLVAEEMMVLGVRGALVNVGGDVRCIGHGPANGTWVIAVGDAVAGVAQRIVEMSEGGIATSTKARRAWKRRTAEGVADTHHLLDPCTGLASASAALAVTVIAARCSDAEWLATSIAATGALPTDRSILGAAAVLLTDHDGVMTTAGSPERYLR